MSRSLQLILVLFLSALLAAASAGAADLPLEAEALNRKMLKLYEADRYQDALPLATQVLKITEKALGPEHPQTAISLNNLAELYRSMGAYNQALPLHQRALKIREKALGPKHLSTATSLNNLALLYSDMGAYDQALPLHQRALEIREKVQGPEHRDTIISLHDLALLYQNMGAFDKALPLYQKAVKVNEKTLGPDHPDTAHCLNSLAGLYRKMGAYDQALPLQIRALKVREKILGPNHPQTAISLNNLALLYQDMGSFDKALPLFQRALNINEKNLVPDHPETATTLHNLGLLHQDMGAPDKAVPLHQRGLRIVEKTRGPEHENTAESLLNLGTAYKQMGSYDKALPILQRALRIQEKALGPEHHRTAISLNNLAELCRNMGAYDQALPLNQRALKLAEKEKGPEDPFTATALTNLAEVYRGMGAHEKALRLVQRALKISEEYLGPEHPKTATSLNNLALLYSDMGAYERALALYQRALKIAEKSLGPEHEKTAFYLSNLGTLFLQMGDYHKALPLHKRAVKIYKKSLGPDHPDTAHCLNSLAEQYRAMGAYDQALPLQQQTVSIMEKALGPNHPKTAASLNNLGGLYLSMGAYDKAVPLYQRALEITEKSLGPEHPETAHRLNNLAVLFSLMGSYDQALPLLQRALKVTEKVLGPEHPQTATGFSNLGAFYLGQGKYDLAETYFRRGKKKGDLGPAELALAWKKFGKVLNILGDKKLTWKTPPSDYVGYFTIRGLALEGLDRRPEAALALVQAVRAVEELRQRVTGEKTGFFQGATYGGYVRPYRGLMAVLAEMALKKEKLPDKLGEYGPGAETAAFYFAEATKGRVLLESLAAAARSTSRVELPEELRWREESLLNQMTALKDQWEKALQGGEIAVKEAKEKKERLVSAQRALVKELRQKFPVYAALHYPEPLPAPELPLKPQEVLLEYALGDKAGYIFVVRKGGVSKVVKIPLGKEELEEEVKAFMRPFLNLEPEGFSLRRAKKLHDLLLAGVLPEVKEDQRLILVPDGVLGLLPFEALVLKPGKSLQDSVFVGDHYTLSYYQSAAVLALKRRLAQEQAGRPLFALGHPVFSGQDQRCRGSKPEAQAASAEAAFTALATNQDWGKTRQGDDGGKELTYPPLPETETEVKDIAQIFQIKPEPPDVLLNLQANETVLKQSPLGYYRYLHFATHADLSDKVQGIKEPFILLGQVENKKGDDGFLTLSEVLGLNLKADMVVLSACVTGRGKVMEGEGVANLARAFQHAGAQSVLVSLWPVASREAVEFMTHFYAHLKEGKSRFEALQLSRRAIKAKYPQPFFWAVFILHGEG